MYELFWLNKTCTSWGKKKKQNKKEKNKKEKEKPKEMKLSYIYDVS